MSSVDEAIAQVPGVVGLAARHFDSGAQIRHDADMPFFTASTFKVPLLVELLRQVDRGEIDLSQRVEMTDAMRVPGSGVLKELEAGLRPTLRDLAMLMIIISDNAATDFLYEMVGRDSLSATIRELGLTRTRIPMSCRELLYSLAALDPSDPDVTYANAAEKLRGEQIDLDADALDEENSDVSSPDDMCELFEAVHRGDVLSPSSRETFWDILKRQQLNTVIPLLLPQGTVVANKTGSYHSVRCDVGVVHSPSGPYAIAIMAKHVDGERLHVDLTLAGVSKAVYDAFNP